MKKLLLMFTAVILFYSFTSASQPPVAVEKAFKQKFPTATNVSWGKEAAKEWEAEFTFEGNKISANFMEDGRWVETEQKIKIAELPYAVATKLKTTYSGWVITEADKTETSKNGTIYEADLKMGKKKKSLAFKENGNIIKE